MKYHLIIKIIMNINLNQKFKYRDYSNNIFTKIQLVNALTQKEFDILNEKYKELGLFIRQVQVDSFGNEIFQNENIFLNKKRRLKKSTKTIKEFYEKYYFNDKKKKPKKSNKNNKNKENKNSSYDSSDNENINCNKKELRNLNDNLKDLYKECQNINIKRNKLDDENYKKNIIRYILKFSKYITEKQYKELFSKWKNENYTIIGFNFSDVNNLYNWKLPILKAFKSEIVLIASTNLLGKQIGEENNPDDNINDGRNDNDEKENDKEEGLEEKDESESISSD